MTSDRTKRIVVLLIAVVALVLLGALYGGFMLSRDVSFDWEYPNLVEATEARRKVKRYEESVAKGAQGWLRFSQLEINSYLMAATTNPPPADARVILKRVSVELTSTNVILYSWGERRLFGLPLNFVVQRAFRVRQHGTNLWDLPIDSLKIGELEIPQKFWPKLKSEIHEIDRPLGQFLSWATNVQAMHVTKNETSQRPELRLYTYRPIAPADLR